MNAIWDWLITPPATGEVLNPLSAVYLVVYLTGFVAASFWLRGAACSADVFSFTRDRLRPCAPAALWIFGAGLLFFAVRALQIEPLMLGAPIWMVLAVFALVVGISRCIVDRTH